MMGWPDTIAASWRGPPGTIAGILRAARLDKNAPMLCLILGGALLTRRPVEIHSLAIAGVTLLIGGALTTHINVLTDADLDKESKPYLVASLRRHWKLSRAILIWEVSATVCGLTALVLCDRRRAASALGIGICLATLYSYNFLARDPVKRRFKATWWTHATVFVGGYFMLWLTGALCSPPGHHGRISNIWPLMLMASVSDYGLALAESGFDAREERAHGLRTMAALLGARGTAQLAAAMNVAATGIMIVVSAERPEARSAFLPSAILVTLSTVVIASSCRAHQAVWRTVLPDLAFLASRVCLIVTLVLIRSHG